MRAAVGDALVVRGRHVDDNDRAGVILEVHGDNGAPPYRVRWRDGRESVFFPSAGTDVQHLPSKRQDSTVANR